MSPVDPDDLPDPGIDVDAVERDERSRIASRIALGNLREMAAQHAAFYRALLDEGLPPDLAEFTYKEWCAAVFSDDDFEEDDGDGF